MSNPATAQAIGIRLDDKILGKVEAVGREERLDRSTTVRLLLEEGYKSYSKRKAIDDYKSGKLTMSKAAERAGITVWEMEQSLVSQGYKSQYSTIDFEEELQLLAKKK